MSKDNKLKSEMRKLEDLVPYKRRLRRYERSIENVKVSIKEYGFNQPIVIDLKNQIVVGNTRYYAAKDLKIKEVPVIVRDFTDEQSKLYRIADNTCQEYSEWNKDFLKDELEMLREFETGFSDSEIDRLLGVDDDKEVDDNTFFELIVETENEETQKLIFEYLKEQGIECRILSI